MSMRRTLRNDTWLKPFFTQYRTAMFASLGLGLLAMVFACGLMFVSGYLIDLSAEQPAEGVWALFVPLAFVQVFGIGKPFLSYFERLRSHDWVLHMTSELRRRLFRAIDANGVFWQVTRNAGELLGLLSDDIGHVQNLYLRSIFPQVIACILWLALSVALGVFTPLLGVVTLVAVGVLVFVVPVVAATVNGARQLRRKELDARLYADVYDNVQGVADWVFAQRGAEYADRVMRADAAKREVDSELSAAARRRDLLVQVLLCAMSVGLLLWAAIHFGGVVQGSAAIGDMQRPVDWVAAFVLGFFPLVEAFVPLSNGAVQLNAHLDSVERLNAVETSASPMRHPERSAERGVEGSPAAGAGSPCIALEDAHYTYPEDTREVLCGIDLTIPAGQKVAVLGPSGSGKSTLLSLLRGDLAPTAGTVQVNGRTASELGDDAAQLMSVIQQDTYLFNATLFDNLALENPQVTRDQAQKALERVGLGALLAELPNGLDTMVDEAGLRFSGGERHRIALARVLLQDAPIVLLDEPCASLDPMTESALLQTLFEVLDGKTVVMVTHHLLGVDQMDRVVFVEEGRVAIDGAPRELAATNERYRQLLTFDRGV